MTDHFSSIRQTGSLSGAASSAGLTRTGPEQGPSLISHSLNRCEAIESRLESIHQHLIMLVNQFLGSAPEPANTKVPQSAINMRDHLTLIEIQIEAIEAQIGRFFG